MDGDGDELERDGFVRILRNETTARAREKLSGQTTVMEQLIQQMDSFAVIRGFTVYETAEGINKLREDKEF